MQAAELGSDATLAPIQPSDPLVLGRRQQVAELLERGFAGPRALLASFGEHTGLLSPAPAEYASAWQAEGHSLEETEAEAERLLQVRGLLAGGCEAIALYWGFWLRMQGCESYSCIWYLVLEG